MCYNTRPVVCVCVMLIPWASCQLRFLGVEDVSVRPVLDATVECSTACLPHCQTDEAQPKGGFLVVVVVKVIYRATFHGFFSLRRHV